MGLAKIGNVFADVVPRFSVRDPLILSKYTREDGTVASSFIADETPLEIDMDCGFADSASGTREDKEAAIRKIKSDKEPITITTDRGTWPNMVLLDIQFDETADNAGAFMPSLHFQQSNTTSFENASVPLDRITDPVKKKVAKDTDKTTDSGKQPTETEENQGAKDDLVAKARGDLLRAETGG